MPMTETGLTCDGCGQRYGDLPNWPTLTYEAKSWEIEREATQVWGWRKTSQGFSCPGCCIPTATGLLVVDPTSAVTCWKEETC